MAESFHGLDDGKDYELVIGSSFRQKQNEDFYHTIKYDFKPASVDSTKASELTVGSNNEVTVKVPHVQESESTVFRGSKRPCNKECILIIDRETGKITLERLASNIQLKKIRSSNQASAKTTCSPAHPVVKISSKPSAHKHRVASKGENGMGKIDADASNKKENTKEKQKTEKQSVIPKHSRQIIASKPSQKNGTMSPSSPASDSDSSSSSSSDTDSDSDQDDLQETQEQAKALDEALMQNDDNPSKINLIDDDLKLTDSDSD